MTVSPSKAERWYSCRAEKRRLLTRVGKAQTKRQIMRALDAYLDHVLANDDD